MKYFNKYAVAAVCMLVVSCSNDGPEFGKSTSGWTFSDNIELTRSDESSMDGIEEFSHALMEKALEYSKTGEFCVSPISISIYLGMLANAAEGDLHDEILEAVGSRNIDDINSLCRKLMQYLPCDENGSSLAISNSFWVAKGIKVPKDFVSTESYYYNAPLVYVDFHKEKTITEINNWVYENTRGKIDGIFDQSWENYKDTKMVCANTVFFNGDWDSPFSKSKTVGGKFKSLAGEIETNMMHKTLNAMYFENDSLQYVRLGFEKYANTMEFYLPEESIDLKDFLAYLSASKMKEIREFIEWRTVDLSMPSFSKYSSARILDILKDLHMPSLEKAHLSPMGIDEMSIVPVHKVSLKVDEEGAEVAAVTANPGEVVLGHPEEYDQVTLVLNRPFVYIIRNQITGAILLAGILNDPR